MKTRSQSGVGARQQPFWLRLIAVFCMGLIGVASTVQVCHSHDDVAPSDGKGKVVSASVLQTGVDRDRAANGRQGREDSDRPGRRNGDDSSVRCPLCVAMHSALPTSNLLVQIAMVRLETMAPQADGIERAFRWRFEMAGRPPPAARFFA